jgi:aminoacylase
MGAFVRSDVFRALGPVGLALDEGLANASQSGACTVFYGERSPWWLIVKAKGPTGHGSRFIEDPATHKLMRVAQRALAFREEQEKLLGYGTACGVNGGCKHALAKKLGDVTTINLTMLRAGVSGDGGKTWNLNVIPTAAEAGFDVRVPPSRFSRQQRAAAPLMPVCFSCVFSQYFLVIKAVVCALCIFFMWAL